MLYFLQSHIKKTYCFQVTYNKHHIDYILPVIMENTLGSNCQLYLSSNFYIKIQNNMSMFYQNMH